MSSPVTGLSVGSERLGGFGMRFAAMGVSALGLILAASPSAAAPAWSSKWIKCESVAKFANGVPKFSETMWIDAEKEKVLHIGIDEDFEPYWTSPSCIGGCQTKFSGMTLTVRNLYHMDYDADTSMRANLVVDGASLNFRATGSDRETGAKLDVEGVCRTLTRDPG